MSMTSEVPKPNQISSMIEELKETGSTVSSIAASQLVRRKMSRSLINFWLDLSLLVVLVCVGWISAMMRIVFPAPTSADGWKLWGMSFNQWSDFQFGALCLFGLLAVEHLVLH